MTKKKTKFKNLIYDQFFIFLKNILSKKNIKYSFGWEDIYFKRNPDVAYDKPIKTFSNAYDMFSSTVQNKIKTKYLLNPSITKGTRKS